MNNWGALCEVKQLALKILINSGYGLFGNPNFKYSDIRVAELITAYGRYTLSKMQEIAKSNGFDIVGGDTDSLFLLLQTSSNDDCGSSTNSGNISKFISKCNKQLNIDVEHSKTFAKAVIVKKKHYLGIDDKGNIIVKGMEGLKNDRPLWINDVFNQFVKDLLTSNCSSTNNTTNNNILVNLRRSIIELEEGKVESSRLKISIKLSKDPDQYATNTPQKKIGLLLNAKSGDVVQYYKSDSTDNISLDPKEISVKKYKNMLWNAVKDILEILGYDINTMKNELLLFFNNDRSMTTRQSLPVAWSGYANLQKGGD